MTTGDEEDSLILLVRNPFQLLEISSMSQSDLLGLRTKPCPRNMVGQHSRDPDLLIVSWIFRRHCMSSRFWASDCGSVLATRYQRSPGETWGKVRRSAHVANPENVCHRCPRLSWVPDTFHNPDWIWIGLYQLPGSASIGVSAEDC